MDAVDLIRLDRKRTELRETVAFKYIAAYLLRDRVINSEEFQLISHNVTIQAQMDLLLEIVIRKGISRVAQSGNRRGLQRPVSQ